MVTALGIDVRRAFTLVFAIGGVLAALAGVLSGVYFGSIDPERGTSLLIFAFIVVVIGGLGSIGGSAVAAVLVGLVQQYTNYYESGVGDLAVVLLLAVTLLVRPGGLAGKWVPAIDRRAPCRLAARRLRGAGARAASRSPRTASSPPTWTARAACSSSASASSSAQLRSRTTSFGFTGLLSFGHALYFAIGAYVCNIALTRWEWSFWQALLLTPRWGWSCRSSSARSACA